MTKLDQNMASLQDRLSMMRQEVDDNFAAMLTDLEQVLGAINDLRSEDDGQEKRLKQLEERSLGQNELIETLTLEAEEARALRAQVRERDLKIEQLSSEVESKADLVRALRRQVSDVDNDRAKARQSEKTISEQQQELSRKQLEIEAAQKKIEELKQQMDAESRWAVEQTGVQNAQMISLKAELDARKSMIKSLKADAEQAETLENQLDRKRETITKLEQAINQHSETIAGLRHAIEAWKEKYQAASGKQIRGTDETLSELPAFTDTELEALQGLEAGIVDGPDATIAIDMKGALQEARREKARSET